MLGFAGNPFTMGKFLLVGTGIFACWVALADGGYDNRAAMAQASRFVQNRATEALSTTSIVSGITHILDFSRHFKNGENWMIAVSRVSPGMVHKAADSEAHRNRFLEPQFYSFHVTGVAPTGEARIEVIEVDKDGKAVEAPRIQRLVITVSKSMRLISKEYHYRDRGPVLVELNVEQNVPMGFDPFPVELPDFERSKVLQGGGLGTAGLPIKLSRLFTHKLDPAKTIRFESPDLLARSMRVTWQRGDLWPALVETNGGVSVLVKQEKL